MKIAIDVYGGDHAPQAVVDGIAAALETYDDIDLVLCGDEAKIKTMLSERNVNTARVTIKHAPDVIGTNEHPVEAIRQKKQSSLVAALDLVASGEADCLVSAGNTGALLAGATLYVRRLPGVMRPALAPLLPTRNGFTLLLDAGANVDCKPSWLQQYAVMGSVYMQKVMGLEKPRVALLNNGVEEQKGNELTKQTYPLLQKSPIHFMGNCEARDLLSGEYDVIVCDGFVGNMVLKCTEGVAMEMMFQLKTELMSGLRTKIGGMLSKSAFKRVKKKLDYTEHGGAPFLGVRGGIIKAHGSSNAKAFAAAIRQARTYVANNVTEEIGRTIAQMGNSED